MSYVNFGSDSGFLINDSDSQEEKEKAVLLATENILKTLREIVSIYAKFGNPAMFEAFQSAVSEAMEQGNYENYFNDDNYSDQAN